MFVMEGEDNYSINGQGVGKGGIYNHISSSLPPVFVIIFLGDHKEEARYRVSHILKVRIYSRVLKGDRLLACIFLIYIKRSGQLH